jgi:hypothetical protein
MSTNNDGDHKERIKLVEPKLQLKQPRSSGSGLKFAGALVTAIAFLFFIFGNSKESETIQLSATEGAAAAGQLEEMTKELSKSPQETKEIESMKTVDSGDQGIEISGIQFAMHVPSGWSVSNAGEQKFVRKTGDSRICQLTVDNAFDAAGLISDAKGNEVEYESQYMKEALGMAIPTEVKKDVRIEVTGSLLSSNYDSNSLSYSVKMHSQMTLGERGVKQIGFNTTVASEKRMVRLQCVNMAGEDDEEDAMEIMSKSLKLLQ